MKKTKLIHAMLLVAACLVSGCVIVPQTVIKGQGWEVRAPKDVELEGLVASRDPATGKVTVMLKKYKARMNPEVIGASADATAKVIESSGNVFQKGVETGAKAFTGGL